VPAGLFGVTGRIVEDCSHELSYEAADFPGHG
jgi:hypothetical protein